MGEFHVKLGQYFIKQFKLGTLKDNSISNNSSVHIVKVASLEYATNTECAKDGNKEFEPSYYEACITDIFKTPEYTAAADCANPEQCPFYEHELYNQFLWYEVAELREDAYNVVCEAFELMLEIKETIEDFTASPTLRLGDALHRLYHKEPSMTWETVITEISKIDYSLAQTIRNSIQ